MKMFTNLDAADKYLGAQNHNEFVRQFLSTSTQFFCEKQNNLKILKVRRLSNNFLTQQKNRKGRKIIFHFLVSFFDQ